MLWIDVQGFHFSILNNEGAYLFNFKVSVQTKVNLFKDIFRYDSFLETKTDLATLSFIVWKESTSFAIIEFLVFHLGEIVKVKIAKQTVPLNQQKIAWPVQHGSTV